MKPAPMQIGWCAPLECAAQLHEAGLDCLEAQLVPMKLEVNAAFADAKARVRDLPLPAPVMSCLFPHDLLLVAPEVHETRARAYFDRVVELMALWTRSVPEGFDAVRAEAQFVQALAWCADALSAIGTTLVIEPLNRKESNQATASPTVFACRA